MDIKNILDYAVVTIVYSFAALLMLDLGERISNDIRNIFHSEEGNTAKRL